MNTPRGKNLHIFVRYGSLNLVYQEGLNSDTYHSPPVRRGLYAFPLVLQERFLIGCLDQTQSDIFKKVKPGEYKDYEAYQKKLNDIRHTFVKIDGTIWHHLGDHTKKKEIIASNKSWVKTSLCDWRKIVGRASINDRMSSDPSCGINAFNQAKGICGNYSKDHYEVFFDEKI